MSSEDFNNEQFFSEFIDDLYAECDERLGSVRRDLLSLEQFVGKSFLEQTLLDALLRHFHTVKGLAGSINLENAERLTHQLENYLRALRAQEIILSVEGISVLITGTKLLEQIIAAHRTHEPQPDIAQLIANLKMVISGAPPPDSLLSASTQEDKPITTPAAITTQEDKPIITTPAITRFWQFEFAPTSERRERGIDVNVIRDRFEAIGEVIEAKPRLASGEAGMVFDFVVSTAAAETDFADWKDDGVSYTLCENPTPQIKKLPVAKESPPSTDTPVAPQEKSLPPNEAPTPSISATTPIPSLATSNMIRVDMARLDELMRIIGDLVTSRARQESNIKKLKPILPVQQWRAMQETNQAQERHLRDLREGIMRVRLVAIGTAFERMQFVVRDMISDTKKSIDLELVGQEIEVDKLVVDKMIEPLLHLVRNAVSHGIETTEERVAQGKPPKGKIRLRASTIGDAMLIEIEDDGRGIDIKNIIKNAHQQSLLDETDEIPDMATLLDILCKPGFTTQKQANLASGRGVGMDVVKNTVNELGGFISFDTQKKVGTRFSIQLPLTLAIADALIVSVSGEKFAIPRLSVREVIEIKSADVTILENNNEIFAHRNNALPLLRLNLIFNLKEKNNKNADKFYALVIGRTKRLGIVVDHILGEREIVVRALHDPLVQVPGIAGASELGDGRVILILDVAALARVGR